MKIKNSQIILVIASLFGVYILFVGYLSTNKSIDIDVKVEEENKIKSEIIPETMVKKLPEAVLKIGPNAPSEEVDNISVSMQVLDKKYELIINDGASVFEAMKKLQDERNSEFSFNYKEYPSLGVFVYEINGMKEKRGEYWIYYVNEKEASVGVSMYILKEGDSILWKQE